jgi:hypothetical protein
MIVFGKNNAKYLIWLKANNQWLFLPIQSNVSLKVRRWFDGAL